MSKCAAYRASLDGSKKVPHVYEYPKPSVTVDNVIIRRHPVGGSDILFIRRKNPPFKGQLALPGGFLEMEESLADGALRELQEETGILREQLTWFEHVGAYGAPGRDPRGRTISIAFVGIVPDGTVAIPADDAVDVEWIDSILFRAESLPNPTIKGEQFAFDHAQVVNDALGKYRDAVSTVGGLLNQ